MLIVSGFVALIYQVAWFRQFQLVFGASTLATSAVLAVFMGGLGLGNAVLGRRADRWANPLAAYGFLELGIAAMAAASPWIVDASRSLYIALGGQTTLGSFAASLARVGLAVVVLGVPTFLMGGTFPAAVRGATTRDDRHRRAAALLYGSNTLGAVLGALAATFVLLQNLGTRGTVWSAAALNLGVGAAAVALARRMARQPARSEPRAAPSTSRGAARSTPVGAAAALDASEASPHWVYLASGALGFVFFLLELVWYRTLGPILGGTTYTFGLILAIALLGIGVGGLIHAAWSGRLAPSVGTFAVTCGLESLAVAAPLALGDNLAWLAARLHVVGTGLGDQLLGWTLVASIAVLPAALISGFQFPLLIALLGRADHRIGRQVGFAYACNTLGAIVGSLAGGFYLLPLLRAEGAWRLAVALLALMGGAAGWMACRARPRRWPGHAAVAVALLSLMLLAADGPTAAWRHGGIGAGRSNLTDLSPNAWQRFVNERRQAVLWQSEGVEAAIALMTIDGLAFFINGKCDGNATGDAGTQIMLGMLGALFHPQPETAMVVGLGTGETAGWLAAVPTMQRVDVVELEPAIVEIARRCADWNHDAVRHPKVRLIFNDAREVLLTTPERYDLIVSEPSNPYRPGIANLFTREFYHAARDRLRPGGVFVQWLQGYEIDRPTIDDVLATLGEVFAHVELWQSQSTDMLLFCSCEPLEHDLPRLRRRIAEEPYRTALRWAWRAADAEAVFARLTANGPRVRQWREQVAARVNTDDRNIIEYRFARHLGRLAEEPMDEVRRAGLENGGNRPITRGESLDDIALDGHRQILHSNVAGVWLPPKPATQHRQRAEMLRRYWSGDTAGATKAWETAAYEPLFPDELAILALAYADQGDDRARTMAARLAAYQPFDAAMVETLLLLRRNQPAEATRAAEQAVARLREEPWGFSHSLELVFPTVLTLVAQHPETAPRLLVAIRAPLAAYRFEDQRRQALWQVAARCGPGPSLEVAAEYEPYPLWDEHFLYWRAQTYRSAQHPLSARAQRDLARYYRRQVDSASPPR